MDDVERLQYTDLDCLRIENEAMYSEIKRLRAEIERLRAALDRAADALEFYDNKAEAIKARAALEPKP